MGKTFQGEEIRLSLERSFAALEGINLQWPFDTLENAWCHGLAPAMADGKVSAFATGVLLYRQGGISTNSPGLVFPPANAPGASLQHFIDDANGAVAIIPNGKPSAHSWMEWHDATFPSHTIKSIWESASDAVPPIERVEDVHGNSLPSISELHIERKKAEKKPPKLEQQLANTFMKERKKNWPAGKTFPVEDDDWQALKENFPNYSVPRSVMRKAREALGPAWAKQGPKLRRSTTM